MYVVVKASWNFPHIRGLECEINQGMTDTQGLGNSPGFFVGVVLTPVVSMPMLIFPLWPLRFWCSVLRALMLNLANGHKQ